MLRPGLPTDPSSPLRRRLLRAALLAPLAGTLATLPGCSLPVHVDGTFLQPWRSHLQWGLADWQRSLKLAHALGCRQLVLQWTGIVGGSDGDWSLPDGSLQQLFTAARENDLRIRVGLPFQQRWWQAIGADDATLQAFLADSLAHARAAGWHRRRGRSSRPSAAGTCPTNWSSSTGPVRPPAMVGAVAARAGAGRQRAAVTVRSPATSAACSPMATWSRYGRRYWPRPRCGRWCRTVGVAGAGNVQQLQPLLDHFQAQGIGFDAIVELFRELPGSAADGSGFRAKPQMPHASSGSWRGHAAVAHSTCWSMRWSPG